MATGLFAAEITDVLTPSQTGVNSSTYASFSNVSVSSKAVYAGNCAGSNNSIQLRSSSANSGIVTTASGGTVVRLKVEWNTSTTDGRKIYIYGSDNPFNSAEDLYKAGPTQLGEITYTSGVTYQEFEFATATPRYIGIRSSSGALYLASVSIVWEDGATTGSGDGTTGSGDGTTGGNTDGGYSAAGNTITFSDMFTSDAEISKFTLQDAELIFAKGTGTNNVPKYYANGTSIRMYGGSTFTVTSTNPNRNLTAIDFTFGSSDGSNQITCDNGYFNINRWEGDAQSVTFTISGTSGNRRLAAVAVTMGEEEQEFYTVKVWSDNYFAEVYQMQLDPTTTSNSDVQYVTTEWGPRQEKIDVYQVRRGACMQLEAYVFDTIGNEFLYWHSSDSTYNDYAQPIITICPTSDMTLTAYAWQREQTAPAGWYTVTIPASELGYGAEEIWMEGMDESDSYGAHVMRFDGVDGSMKMFVQPGYGFYLYINSPYTDEGEQIYNYNYLARFSSSDRTYQGAEAHVGGVLNVFPTGDMTLTVDEVYYGYWNLTITKPQGADVEVIDANVLNQDATERMDVWMEESNSDDTELRYMVKKGLTVRVKANVFDTTQVFYHWESNIQEFNNTKTAALEFTPTQDVSLNMVTGPHIYYTITLRTNNDAVYYDFSFDETQVVEQPSPEPMTRIFSVKDPTVFIATAFTQMANEYVFSYWMVDGEVYSRDRQLFIELDNDVELTAVFEPNTVKVMVPLFEGGYVDAISGTTTVEREVIDSVEYSVYFVMKGDSLTLQYTTLNGDFTIDHWVSDDKTLNLLTSPTITFTPIDNMIVSVVTKESFERVRVTFVRPNAYTNIKVEYPYYSDIPYLLKVDSTNTEDTYLMRVGISFEVSVEVTNPDYHFEQWNTSTGAWPQDYQETEFTFAPDSSMVITPVVNRYYTLTVYRPDMFAFTDIFSEDVSGYEEMESPSELQRIFSVREGQMIDVYADTEEFSQEFDHWNANVATLDGDTNKTLSFQMLSDVTLTPVFERAFYEVQLLGSDSVMIVPDYMYDLNYDDFYTEYRSLDGEQDVPFIYIRKGTSLPITFETPRQHPDYVLDHWISSDAKVNGDTIDPLILTPTADMTLGLSLRSDFWRISLSYNYFSADYLEQIELRDANAPEVNPVQPYAPRRSYGVSEQDVFLWREEDPTGAGDNWFYLVKKGTTVIATAPGVELSNAYHFDHWISSSDSINGSTEYPLVFTPYRHMSLDFVIAQNMAIVGNDTILLSDSISAVIDLVEDGSISLELDNGYGVTTMFFDSAQISGMGLASDITTLVLDIVNASSIHADTIEGSIGLAFTGDSLIITSSVDRSVDSTTVFVVSAAQGIVGNGWNSLTIDGRLLVSSVGATTVVQAPIRRLPGMTVKPGVPAISQFDTVYISPRVQLQAVWYDDGNGNQIEGDTARCKFNSAQQAFGEVDMDASSFTPATTLVFADGAFYTDYLEGNIDIPTDIYDIINKEVMEASDQGYYDILGRPLDGPQQGIYIHAGRVYLAR